MKFFDENLHRFVFRTKVGAYRQYKCTKCCLHIEIHGTNVSLTLNEKTKSNPCGSLKGMISLGNAPDGKEYFATQGAVDEIKEYNKKLISSLKNNPYDFSKRQTSTNAIQKLEEKSRSHTT